MKDGSSILHRFLKPVSTTIKPQSSPWRRSAKRIKLDHDPQADGSPDNEPSSYRVKSPRKEDQRRVIPDSDEDPEDEIVQIDTDETDTPPQRTDIEAALPPVATDKEAIKEYETLRASEQTLPSTLHERLGQRQWVKGKSSIYVDAFNMALETVLEDESHLFDQAEMRVFEEWRGLGYEAQYLYVRLFLRKTSAWHRINRLGYYSDIADMDKAIQELYMSRTLPPTSDEPQITPGELEPPDNILLGDAFTFADCSDEHITTLEEASTLLKLDELKVFAKEAKVIGKNKTELLKALRRTSGRQTGLGFASLQRTDTEESTNSTGSNTRDDSPGENRDTHFTRKILAETGPCIRLATAPCKLFERVHLVFYRSTEWTEKSLTTIILARIARRNFPSYIVSRSANIFPSRTLLLEFEAALRTQFRIDTILEFNGTPTLAGLESVLVTYSAVLPRWRALLREEQQKEDSIYLSGEGAYLRRLSPAWVYTRIVHKGAYILGMGKFKRHAEEHAILGELLTQRLFHSSRRGAWYQRKALLEEHYMAALTPCPHGVSEDDHKKQWKRTALRTCEQALQDNQVHLIYHYDLQKRITKLERSLKVPKRIQHEFGHAGLAKPQERTVTGTQVLRRDDRPSTPTLRRSSTSVSTNGNGSNTLPSGSNTLINRRGAKTIWLDPATEPPQDEVSVEAMCLSHYRTSLGYKGYHTEGGLLRTLFALLFYDILFTYIPHVFQTPYQTCPLDLHAGDGAFYSARSAEINARLAEISNGKAEGLVTEVWQRESERKTCVVGLDWSFDKESLREVVKCFTGEQLSCVCRVMAQEYAERGGGMPDLFLWKVNGAAAAEGDAANAAGDEATANIKRETNNENGHGHGHDYDFSSSANKQYGTILFSEVKSANDRLSDTQRLWIHVLTGAGIPVELCNAVAGEVVYR